MQAQVVSGRACASGGIRPRLPIAPLYDSNHEAPLRRIARSLLRDPADQDDALQEAWVTRLTDGREAGRASGWMASVVRNRCRRIWARRDRTEPGGDLDVVAPRARGLDPALAMDRKMVRDLLLATIDQLSEDQARVMRLRYFDELSLAEIAERTGAPVGTVKSHLSRGLADMRRRLEGRFGDRGLTAVLLARSFDLDAGEAAATSTREGGRLGVVAVLAGAALVAALVLPGMFRTPAEAEVPTASSADRPPRTMASVPDAEERGLLADDGASTAVPEEAAPPPTPIRAFPPMRMTFSIIEQDETAVFDFRARVINAESPHPFHSSDANGVLAMELGEEHVMVDGERAPSLPGEDWGYIHFQFELPGHARPRTVQLPFLPGKEQHQMLALAFPAHDLLVRVQDEDGEPIAGASVRVGSEVAILTRGPVFEREILDATTDAQGSCLIEAYDSPCVEVRVSSPAHVAQHLRLYLTPDSVTEHVVVLESGPPLTGVVLDADGNPVVGARIYTDTTRDVPQHWAVSGPNGAYRFRCATPGPQRAWALGPPDTGLAEHFATTQLDLAADGTEWNPVLEPPFGLEVELIDSEGIPWEARLVFVTYDDASEPWDWFEVARTDAAGRVRFPRVPREALRVELRSSLPGATSALLPYLVERGIYGGDKPVRILQESADLFPLGSIRAVVLHQGFRVNSFVLSCWGPLTEGRHRRAYDGDRFCLWHVPPGTYTIAVGNEEVGFTSRFVDLQYAETKDITPFELPETGLLRIESRWPRDAELKYSFHSVHETIYGDRLQPITVHAQPPEEMHLLPGRVLVCVERGGVDLQWRVVEVESGETTPLLLDPGRPPGAAEDRIGR